jgi:hypothetical protein
LTHVSKVILQSIFLEFTCAGFVGQKRRKEIPYKLHLLLYKRFHLFQHSRLTNPTLFFSLLTVSTVRSVVDSSKKFLQPEISKELKSYQIKHEAFLKHLKSKDSKKGDEKFWELIFRGWWNDKEFLHAFYIFCVVILFAEIFFFMCRLTSGLLMFGRSPAKAKDIEVQIRSFFSLGLAPQIPRLRQWAFCINTAPRLIPNWNPGRSKVRLYETRFY